MLAPITHILPLTTVVRKRILPIDGRVLGRLGEKVNSTDLVASANLSHEHLIINAAQLLNISPRDVSAFIKIKKGQQVSQREVIAKSGGFFAREVLAPADGRVVAIGGGKIVIETVDSPYELVAGIPGFITEIIPKRGVVIRSVGSLIQGVWGNGRIDSGVMVSAMEHPDEVFDTKHLDISIRGAILLGGYAENPDVIKKVIDLRARGLILASMSPALVPLAVEAAFPIMVLEGFGRRPINSIAYKLLSTNVMRDVTLNAETHARGICTCPEVFIPLPVSQNPPEPQGVETFAAGQKVRVVSLIHPSQLGTIIQLPANQVAIPNGLKAKTAEVRLESGEHVLAPLTNLEVLG